MDKENAVFFVMLATIIVGMALLVFSVAGFFNKPSAESAAKFAGYIGNEGEDICAVPPGTDLEEWKEHLSHHPDRYAECLK